MRAALVILVVMIALSKSLVAAQETPTPTSTPVATPTAPPYRLEQVGEQTVRYDYIITTGEVMIAGLLAVLVISVWVFVGLFFIVGVRRD